MNVLMKTIDLNSTPIQNKVKKRALKNKSQKDIHHLSLNLNSSKSYLLKTTKTINSNDNHITNKPKASLSNVRITEKALDFGLFKEDKDLKAIIKKLVNSFSNIKNMLCKVNSSVEEKKFELNNKRTHNNESLIKIDDEMVSKSEHRIEIYQDHLSSVRLNFLEISKLILSENFYPKLIEKSAKENKPTSSFINFNRNRTKRAKSTIETDEILYGKTKSKKEFINAHNKSQVATIINNNIIINAVQTRHNQYKKQRNSDKSHIQNQNTVKFYVNDKKKLSNELLGLKYQKLNEINKINELNIETVNEIQIGIEGTQNNLENEITYSTRSFYGDGVEENFENNNEIKCLVYKANDLSAINESKAGEKQNSKTIEFNNKTSYKAVIYENDDFLEKSESKKIQRMSSFLHAKYELNSKKKPNYSTINLESIDYNDYSVNESDLLFKNKLKNSVLVKDEEAQHCECTIY